MSNKIQTQYSKSSVKKTLKYLFFELFISKFFIGFLIFTILINPTTFISIYFTTYDLTSYSLLLILIPLVLSIFLLFLISYKFFSRNKYDYTDSILLTSYINRKQLFWLKILITFLISLITYLFWSIFDMIFLVSIKENTLILIYFVNLFINEFISLLFIFTFSILCIKFKEIQSVIFSILVCLIFLTPSLFTRKIISNNNISISYKNEDINFVKLVNNNNAYYGAKMVNKNYLDVPPIDFINNINIANYFIPSEWILSFYNGAFNDASPNNQLNSNYSLNSNSFYQISNEQQNNLNSNIVVMRAEDKNIFSLNSYEFSKQILLDIENMISNENIIDINNDKEVYLLKELIKNNYIWNNQALNELQLNTIRCFTGINTKYNSFYYLIKYKNHLNNNFELLKQNISNKYSSNLWDLIEFIINSDSTKYNLFNSTNVLSTSNDIKYYYPSSLTINTEQKTLEEDIDFIKNNLIRFENNTPYYLANDNNYYTDKYLITNLQSLDNSIVDNESWNKFASKLSLKYDYANNFLSWIKSKYSNVIDYSLSPNYFDRYEYDYYLELKPRNYIWFSDITIAIISLLFLMLIYLAQRENNKNIYI